MNKQVNPFLAFALVILFGSLFALTFHFYQQAVDVPKLSHVKSSPSGNVHLLLGDKIYDYTADGKLNHVVDLAQLQITNHFGDFAFFSNGDLLINRDEYLPSTKDKVDTFLRNTNTDQTRASNGLGLQRCNLSTLICTQFTSEVPTLQSAFQLFIDPKTDDVYSADTRRHAVRKLDKDGHLLAEITSGLNFPNQVWLDQSTLWIVDTNNHVMKAVQSDTESFGQLIETHKTTASTPWIWPSAFSKVGDKWWLIISDGAMENAKLTIFDSKWTKESVIQISKNADPITSLVLKDKVIITDGSQFSLYQFSFDGQRLDDFAIQDDTPLSIQSVLQKNKAKADKYYRWSNYTLWLGASFFILIFIFAIIQSIKESNNENESAEDKQDNSSSLTSLPADGVWLESKTLFKDTQRAAVIIFIITILLTSIMVYRFADRLSLELISLLLVVPLIFLIMLPINTLSQLKIGFFNDKVTVKTPKGQMISVPYHEIKWHKRAFIVGNWVVPIGNAAQSIFPYERLTELLLPRVLESNRLTERQLLKYQWHSPDGMLKGVVLAIIVGATLLIISKREEILAFLSSLGVLS